MFEEEADAREHGDRHAQPVPDGEGDRVETEVVAEFVGEHPTELEVRQDVDGVGGDDHEVAPARERVEVVGVENGEDVTPRR
ncbi:unannotated protein [freshwater metagenome]|uniref:Unannotated protein n=1 Tax=freshwater metagenome TaxID=449393 RepID=A0A6J7ESD6_9ZZZZ